MRTVVKASPLWVEVMTRAGYRCEGLIHRSHDRCPHEHPGHELVVAPRDPAIAEHAAWRIPAADQAAWCPSCLADARRKALVKRRRPRLCAGQQDLLALIPDSETRSGMSDLSGTTVTSHRERGGAQ